MKSLKDLQRYGIERYMYDGLYHTYVKKDTDGTLLNFSDVEDLLKSYIEEIEEKLKEHKKPMYVLTHWCPFCSHNMERINILKQILGEI